MVIQKTTKQKNEIKNVIQSKNGGPYRSPKKEDCMYCLRLYHLSFYHFKPFFDHFKLTTPLFLISPIIVEIRSCGETLS